MTFGFEWNGMLAVNDEEETVGAIPRYCSLERLKKTTMSFS
jgi:hypothetical protein